MTCPSPLVRDDTGADRSPVTSPVLFPQAAMIETRTFASQAAAIIRSRSQSQSAPAQSGLRLSLRRRQSSPSRNTPAASTSESLLVVQRGCRRIVTKEQIRRRGKSTHRQLAESKKRLVRFASRKHHE